MLKGSIVEKLIKVDLHIHSVASIKDKKIVSKNTIDRLEVLINRLKENSIDMIAITDHNEFDYDLYQKLKENEKAKNIKKVLPGIEFDVEFNGERIHVISIFDDSDEKRIKNISVAINQKFDNDLKNAYKEKTFKDILKEIDLNVVLIAHQKSGIRADNQNENLSKVGEELFDTLIGVDYFDAVEFRSGKVEGILKDYKEEKNLPNLRYITGTDCHVWDAYPQQSEKDKSDIRYSYLKCLPTFKGLVMSLTEPRRVTTAPSEIRTPFIEKLNIKIDKENCIVPLSSGLNVIVGDNSIGKSLLLESLINPSFNGLNPSSKKKGYANFLKNNKIKITSFTDMQIKQLKYDRQGNIREIFQSGSKLLDVPFLKDKFLPLDTTIYLKEINSYVEKVLKLLSQNQKRDDMINNLNFDIVIPSDIEDKTYRLRIIDKLDVVNIDYSKIISNLKLAIKNLDDAKKIDDFEDQKKIDNIKVQIQKIINKYEEKGNSLALENEIKKIVKNIGEKFEKNSKKLSEAQDNKITEFKNNIVEVKRRIINMIVEKNSVKENILGDFKKIFIKSIDNQIGNYKFVTRTKENIIDEKVLTKILTYPLSRVTSLDKINEFNEHSFESKIKSKLLESGKDFATIYKNSVNEFVTENILNQENVILYNDDDISGGNSPGKNALIYLDILSNDKNSKLYVVDQPDDDVSHGKVNKDLIDIFRNMSDNKQILFITHKPELVVNLDVDNVIVIKQNENGDVVINSGALEYSCNNYNILNLVAEILDGGAETIRRRWKRYDKRS